jgi:hypothetical protein
VTGNDGQQYPPQEPAPEYWQQYPDQYGQYPPQQPAYGYEPPQQQYTEPGYEYGYDTGQYPAGQYDTAPYDTPAYDAAGYGTGQQQYQYTAVQPGPAPVPAQEPAPAPDPVPEPAARVGAVPEQRRFGSDEFTFVDEEVEESEEVIDWMKFSETRGERRDERRRRLRAQAIALVVVLALAAAGTVGYLWANGRLFAATAATVAPDTTREVFAVHLHDVVGSTDLVSTALLVSDPAAHKGSILLVPGGLAIPSEGGGSLVQLASAVDTQGPPAVRSGLNTLLGSDVTSTWTLYTPYLQILVDHLQGISVDADTTITQNGRPLVTPGTSTLNGAAAIAYATYQGSGEQASAQMSRYGQVLQAVISAMPQDPTQAASDITAMGALADPSLPDSQLGAMLAVLSQDAKAGDLQTQTLPVNANGSLGASADAMVKQLLGGTVTSTGGQMLAARVSVVNASGVAADGNLAGAAVVNGGYDLVPGTTTARTVQAESTISYTDDARAADARQLAEDLDLPATAVRKVTTTQNADLVVVLGRDYHQG